MKNIGNIRREGVNTLYIKTSVGEIKVELNKFGKEYPGVEVSLEGPQIATNGDNPHNVPLAIVEYDEESKELHSFLWKDTQKEEFDVEVEHQNYKA